MEVTTQSAVEVNDAFVLEWSGFEDARQMASACNAEANKIITLDRKFRNKDKTYTWTPSDMKSYLVQNLKQGATPRAIDPYAVLYDSH